MVGSGTQDALDTLPPLYAKWLREVVTGPIPAETKATCASCAMCKDDSKRPAVLSIYFEPAIKCCTYMPEMFNFLVGNLLADSGSDSNLKSGQRALELRIAQKIAVSPYGVGATPKFNRLYKNSGTDFGKNPELLCPYYNVKEGLCGVWRYRNSICATWFCKHERGAVGLEFWRLVRLWLTSIEQSLVRWCVSKLNLDEQALLTLFAPPFPPDNAAKEAIAEDSVDFKLYRKQWGQWLGREQEFYLKCAELVNELSWLEVGQICGPQTQILADLTQKAYQKLVTDQTTEVLQVIPLKVLGKQGEYSYLRTYRDFDPLGVPTKLVAALNYFNGKPTSEVLQAIETETGLRVNPNLVRKLADFNLLVPVENE